MSVTTVTVSDSFRSRACADAMIGWNLLMAAERRSATFFGIDAMGTPF
jgi:hypothetical protein